MQIVDECKALIHFNSISSLFKTFILVFLLFFNVSIFGQSTCSTALNNVPDTIGTAVIYTPTSNNFWFSFVGGDYSDYSSSVIVNDTTTPKPLVQNIAIYNGSCSSLMLLKQDTTSLSFDSISSGVRYYVCIAFSSTPDTITLWSTYPQPKSTGVFCPNTLCDPFILNGNFDFLSFPFNNSNDPFNNQDSICAWGRYIGSPQAYSGMGFLDNGYASMWASQTGNKQKGEGIFQFFYIQPGVYDVTMSYKQMFSNSPVCDRLIFDLLLGFFYKPIDNSLLDPQINVLNAFTINNSNWETVIGEYTADFTGLVRAVVMPYQNSSTAAWVAVDNIHMSPKPTATLFGMFCKPMAYFEYQFNSCNQLDSVMWNFGDGGTLTMPGSQVVTPHLYTMGGSYNVSATFYYDLFNTGVDANFTTQFVFNADTISSAYSVIGNRNTCDTIVQYTITNPLPNSNYTWTISPANAGNITVNNNTSVTINWHNNNLTAGTPVSVTVCDSMCCTEFKVWKCCTDTAGTATVFHDQTIISNLGSGPYYLNGTTTINANVNFSNSIFYMGQDAKIVVNAPYTFTLNTATLKAGCNYMWDGVYIGSSHANFVAQSAVIQDAENGIVSNNGGYVTATSTLFNKNYHAIKILNSTNSGPLSITGCSFFSTTDATGNTQSNLIAPRTGSRGKYGIYINNVYNAQVGTTNPASRNQFRFLDFGVNVNRSNVNVYNNIFYKMVQYGTNNGYGINIEGNSETQYSVNVGGYNNASARYSNLFFDCNIGIYQQNPTNLKVICDTFSTIQNTAVSIFANQNRNIEFTKNSVYSASKGLFIIDFANTRLIVDSNNLVYISNCGLFAGNATQQECYGATFRKNRISGTFLDGIYIGNVLARSLIPIPPSGGYERSIPYLYGNTITLTSYNVSTNYYRGICVDNCNKTYLEDNNVSTTPAYSITTEAQAMRLNGIFVSASPYTTFCMDTITKFGMGIRMSGLCSSSKLLVNKIESNFYGVRLDNATIDNQGNTALRWVFRNSWTYPYVIGRYRVQGSLATAIIWTYDNIGLSVYSLLPSVPEYSVSGGFTTTAVTNPVPQSCSGYNGVIWIPVNGGFGNGMSNGAESEEILNTENFTMDSEENLYYQAACNYRELQANSNTENNYPVNSLIQSTSIEQFYIIDKLISENRIEEATIANRSILPVNLIEQNHQTANAIYLQSWAKGRFELTEEEKTVLMDIANQSHIKGGYGVFTAWIMLEKTFHNELFTPKSTINKIDAVLPIIYPNPAHHQITITNASEVTDVIVFDLQGREVLKSKNTSLDEIIILNISKLKKGIYFISLINSDFSNNIVEKLIIE